MKKKKIAPSIYPYVIIIIVTIVSIAVSMRACWFKLLVLGFVHYFSGCCQVFDACVLWCFVAGQTVVRPRGQ